MEAMKGRIGGGASKGVGLFGGIGAGVVCNSTDNSWYCTLTKFTSAIMQILVMLILLYVVWEFVSPYLRINKRGGGIRSR